MIRGDFSAHGKVSQSLKDFSLILAAAAQHGVLSNRLFRVLNNSPIARSKNQFPTASAQHRFRPAGWVRCFAAGCGLSPAFFFAVPGAK
jgi:hypothetical protein